MIVSQRTDQLFYSNTSFFLNIFRCREWLEKLDAIICCYLRLKSKQI